jgi:hypothetical protein
VTVPIARINVAAQLGKRRVRSTVRGRCERRRGHGARPHAWLLGVSDLAASSSGREHKELLILGHHGRRVVRALDLRAVLPLRRSARDQLPRCEPFGLVAICVAREEACCCLGHCRCRWLALIGLACRMERQNDALLHARSNPQHADAQRPVLLDAVATCHTAPLRGELRQPPEIAHLRVEQHELDAVVLELNRGGW